MSQNVIHTSARANLVALLIMGTAGCVVSGPAQTPNNTVVIPSDIPSVQSIRDPAAIKILSDSLQALGGTKTWNQIREIEVRGTSQNSTPHSEKQSFRWLDAWSGRSIYFRRENLSGGLNQPYIYSPRHPPRGSEGKKHLALPLFSLPSPHLPGAVIAVLLEDLHCGLALISPVRRTPSDTATVQAICPASRGAYPETRQSWEISLETRLPVRVTIYPPANIINGATTWRYEHFTSKDSLMLPDEFTIQHSHIFSSRIHIDGVKIPEKFDRREFMEAQ